MKPCVLYGAKSTDDVHGSVPAQLQRLRAAAEAEGFTVIQEYGEAALSAWKGNRGPELQKAMTHAERLRAEHGSCAFFVDHSDRMARGDGKQAKHVLHYMLWALEQELTLRSLKDPQTFTSLVMGAVGGDQNQGSSAEKSQRVTEGHDRRKGQRGLHHGARRKFGYTRQVYPDGTPVRDAPLLEHPAEAEQYRQMVDAVLNGVTGRQLAKDLHDQGVRTSQGGRWHPSSVRKILQDPFYAGKLRLSDGTLVDGQQPALITWETYLELQAAWGSPRARGGRPTVGREALFKNGHLRCGRCGGSMGYRSKPNRRSVWERYACCEHERDERVCPQPPVSASGVELAAHSMLREFLGSIHQEVTGIQTARRADVELTEARLAEARTEAGKVEARLRRVTADYQDGELSARRYEEQAADLEEQLAAARAQVERLGSHTQDLEVAASVDVQGVMLQAMERLEQRVAAALKGQDVPAARALFQRAFPEVTLHQVDGRVWLDAGTPARSWVEAELVDELGATHAGEPVLTRSASTDHLALPWCPLVAEVQEEVQA